MSRLVIIGPVRLSYLTVHRPRPNEMKKDSPLEYSLVALIPKAPTKFCPAPELVLKSVQDAIAETMAEKFGKGVTNLASPLRDGDAELRDDGTPKNPGYWFMNVWCSADYPPLLIDGRRQAVTAEHNWKSGDWGKVQVAFWPYDTKGKKGVGVGLRAVQFLYRDDALGAIANINDFEEVLDADVSDASIDDPFADDLPVQGELV